MPEHTAQPVFIFLPVREPDYDEGGTVVVDPVCGRSLAGGKIAGQLRYEGRRHSFCSLECAGRFAASVREPDVQ